MYEGFVEREIKISQKAHLDLIRKIKETGQIPRESLSRKRNEMKEGQKELSELESVIHHMEEKESEWSIERSLLRDKINEATDKVNKVTDKVDKVTEMIGILLTIITENLNDPKEVADQTEELQAGIQSKTHRQNTEKKEDGENAHEVKGDTHDQETTGNNKLGIHKESPVKGEDTKEGLGQRRIGLSVEDSKCKQREAADAMNRRKNLILLGHQEESNQINDLDRKKKDEEYIGGLIRGLLGKEGNRIDYKAHRLGISNGESTRPIKISFKDKNTVDRILQKGYKIQKLKRNEKLTLRSDLSIMERRELHGILNEVRQLNNQRTAQEKEQFFFKVVGGKITKRYVLQLKGRRKKQREQEGTRYSN